MRIEKKRKKIVHSRKILIPILFILPALALNILVVLGPSLATFYFALTKWSGLGMPKFVGLANFSRLMHDEIFYIALLHNIKWTIIYVTIPIAMGFLGASLVTRAGRCKVIFRTIFFVPVIIAPVVYGQLWKNIYHPHKGIGVWLAQHGLPWANLKFLGDTRFSLYSIAFADNWHWWGFLVVVFLAAMQQIDPVFYESARVEGANRWQEFWYITLPLVKPTLTFMLLMTVVWSFLAFDIIYIMTGGGPGYSSEVLGTYLYKRAFTTFEAGYGASIGVMIAAFCSIFIFAFIFLKKKGGEI